ncbi:bifunctional RNase H/acid phosphatase [Streptomyces actuosus]|uniref:Bifunctional RNase H/acid phosphatase n=1 Tax=Streptomyces actuosus TaxID=1885 RepID=A0ABS2VP41_STRAS|nr:bifunctional RNase H/acid phosphatase [Streptomyces actuosus]MBN0044858.1 bifunctional RNase H/acid phosphatase [Streptomyces actuosus]
MREFIVEADGGSRGNPGPAGHGSVVRDAATGETLVEHAEYIGVATNNVAEYRGLVAGLRAAYSLDPEASVHVRMDSKLVVEQMSGRWRIKHPDMKPLAAEAARVFPPGRVDYEWIPREQNKHADRLANEAMDAGRRGEQWDPSTSRAALAAPADRPSEPTAPPGDAAAGAARARAALAQGRTGRAAQPEGPGGTAQADLRAARSVAAGAGLADAARAAAPGETAPGETATDTAATDTTVTGTTPAETTPALLPAEGTTVPAPSSGASSSGAPATAEAAPVPDTSPRGWSAAPDLGAPATFVLLRHGETPLTPQKRFSGSGGTDPSLSDVGREQADRVAAALARRGTIEHIVTSPLARTRETAGIVAARLGLETVVDDGLRETDFGAWEGLTFAEVRERHPEDLNAWLASADAAPTGGGESFAATATRVAAARDRLVAAYAGRTVLLVTHVTPIKTLVRLALGAPPESLFRMELSAASLSAVAYYADGNASVRLLNDTAHLR